MQLSISGFDEERLEDFYDRARYNMVNNQVIPNGVTNNAIIEAMLQIPRECFVEKKWQPVAYIDDHLPVSDKRKILKPDTFARMLQESKIDSKSSVLDIAFGLGYSTAVIASIAKHVTGVENITTLLKHAEKNLKELNIKNAELKKGNLFEIQANPESYDVILINGMAESFPKNMTDLIKDKGKIILIEPCEGSPRVVKYTKFSNHIVREELFYAHAPLITNNTDNP